MKIDVLTMYFLYFFMLLLLSGCQLLVGSGLITPTPTPDPYWHYRALLQPHAQGDIEAAGPLPAYHITAKLNEDGTALSGVMQLTTTTLPDEAIFRLYPNLENYGGRLEITQAFINQQPVDVTYLAENSAARMAMPARATAPFIIDIGFTTRLNQNGERDYALFGWKDDILSLPGFFPVLAARPDGEWRLDIPPLHGDVLFNEAALYQLDITLPRELTPISSGVTLNAVDDEAGWRTWRISGGPLRDMTVIAGPFRAISENAAGATVTSYYLPEHEAAGAVALAHTAASLRLYTDLYGPYPYTELDVVEAPLGSRGMEYSGLILIGSDLYAEQRQYLTFLVAHETAHQWWYSVVGNDPYLHPWLDEGLTEYSAFDYYRTVFGQADAEQLLVRRWQIPFEQATSSKLTGQVNQPASAFDEVSYELLVYSKAALFLHALRTQLGEDMYRQAIQSYYLENKYRIASPQTFLATVERISGENINPLVEQWLE
jgi:hypothetical protein